MARRPKYANAPADDDRPPREEEFCDSPLDANWEWTEVSGYEGKYRISVHGELQIRGSRGWYDARGRINTMGQRQYALSKNGVVRFVLASRLVYENFVGPIPAGMEVFQTDESCANIFVENLALRTPGARVRATLHKKQKSQIDYGKAHRQVKALWGPARLYDCIYGCGRRAADWAYDGHDPTELYASDNKVQPYSRYPEYYVPACRLCHRRADAEKRAERLIFS